jgi:DnaK suppressor protein
MAKKKADEDVKKTKSDGNKATSKSEKEQNVIEEVKTPPTVRYSDEDLDMFRKNIIESKEEALEEMQMLKDRLDDLTSGESADESMVYSVHMAEQGSEAIEKEKTYAQIQRTHEYIKKLEDALIKIDEKTYGICRICGCLIAKERLLAVPVTTLSASYKIHKKCPEDGIDKIEKVRS